MSLAIMYILISVALCTVGQLMLKKGMDSMGPLTLSIAEAVPLLWHIFTNLYVFLGLAIYLFGTVFWLVALSRVDLSYAYPFASLSYVVMLVASWQLFNETITIPRLLGSLVVCLGVLLISRG